MKIKRMETLLKGDLVMISTGGYSDYSVAGLYRVLDDLDPNVLAREWVELDPRQGETYHFDYYKFIVWIVGKGLLEEIPTREWHLSNYSTLSEMALY